MPASMGLPLSVFHPAALAPAPGAASSSVTSYPCSTRAFAAPNPAQPPPMTATRGRDFFEEDEEEDEEEMRGAEEVEVGEEDEVVVGDSSSASPTLLMANLEFPGAYRLNCAAAGDDDDDDRRERRPAGCEERGPAGRRRESMGRSGF